MTVSQQKVYLLTEPQRDALLSYLQERPYKEVASGIEFLLNATTAVLNASSGDEAVSPTPESPEASDDSSENAPQ
jgi:hypothetical protein